MSRKKTGPKLPPHLPERIEFETFRDLRGAYTIQTMESSSPSCFNGHVSFRKFRVTIELIDEPIEVLKDRVQSLWDESDNWHHVELLKSAAESVGLTLNGWYGKSRKGKA